MRKYKIRTIADLHAFRVAFDNVVEVVDAHAAICLTAAVTVLENVENDGAAPFGLAVRDMSLNALRQAVDKFEPTVVRLLGTERKLKETHIEYVNRISSLVGGSPVALQIEMEKRGFRLMAI